MTIRLPRLYTARAKRRAVLPPQAKRGERGGKARSACPPALTGGESPAKAKVDWLTFTFQVDRDVLHDREHLDLLRNLIGPNVTAVSAPGMLGYAHGVRYFARVEDQEIAIARLDWGGNHHRNRARFDLSGTGCSKVSNWQAMADFIGRQFDYKITRVDLACDLLHGQYTVEDCVDWYRQGDFNAGGRNPRHSLVGDWLKPVHGRTLEVGRRTNGKMLRAYEKGRQLGDAESPWTRFEVEFRSIDRDLSTDYLIRCDHYFAGAYRCLQKLLDAVPASSPTHQTEGEISLEHLTKHLRTAYGKCLHVLRLSMSAEDIVSSLTVNGIPARLEKAAVSGFLPKTFSSGERYENASHRL